MGYKPTVEEIAEDENLWNEYANPYGEDDFSSMTVGERVEMIEELWPEYEGGVMD